MTDEEKHIDLIEGFLQNSLSNSELEEFENLLIKDDGFGRLFIEMKTMVDGIRNAASRTTVEEKLRRLEGSDIYNISAGDNKPSTARKDGVILVFFNYLGRQKWAVAAVLTFFVAATVLLVNINTKPSGDKLFDEYFAPFGTGGTYGLLRGDSAKNDLQHQAFYYYDQEEYTLADDYFDKVLDKDSKNIMALFYSGNALLAIGRVYDAIERFKEVIDLGGGLEIQAEWYLALCYLKINDYAKMVPLLNDIIGTNTRYSEMARELLNKINR